MKKIFLISGVMIFFFSCKKDQEQTEPQPEMSYLDMNDTTVLFNRGIFFDLDGDNQKDIYFTTMYVGDPVLNADKKQWLVMSSFYSNLPVNVNENLPVMQKGESIPLDAFNGYSWYNASSVLLAQKIITNTHPPYWEGTWKEASHRFIPFQVIKDAGLYNGWLEVSFDTTRESLTIHRAAISLKAGKEVKAGM